MQYLLTEEEKAALVPRGDHEALKEALEWCFRRLQPKHCPRLVDHPCDAYCNDDGGCPLESQTMGSFGKVDRTEDLLPNKISRLICKLHRSYGK